jgi:hypothetical protein
MKKFIFVSMVATAALSLTACEPTAEEEVVAPEEVTVEAPEEAMAPMDDGMMDDGMEGAAMPEDDDRGNPVDRAP